MYSGPYFKNTFCFIEEDSLLMKSHFHWGKSYWWGESYCPALHSPTELGELVRRTTGQSPGGQWGWGELRFGTGLQEVRGESGNHELPPPEILTQLHAAFPGDGLQRGLGPRPGEEGSPVVSGKVSVPPLVVPPEQQAGG